MKRTAIILVAVLWVLPLAGQSQNQYYYRIGDTIYGRDTTYQYPWWPTEWLASDPMHKTVIWYQEDLMHYMSLHGRVFRCCYTDQPISIAGIATTLYTWVDGSATIYSSHWHPCSLPPIQQEYLLLYEADTSRRHFYEVGRLPFDYSNQGRYMHIPLRGNRYDCCDTAEDSEGYVKIREYYFDKPIEVRDSFYVGHTQNTNWWPGEENPFTDGSRMSVGTWMLEWSSPADRWYESGNITPYDGPCLPDRLYCESTPVQLYRYKRDDWSVGVLDSNWNYCTGHYLLLEFPILLIDSSFFEGPPQYVCPPVQNFRLVSTAEGGEAVMLFDTHSDHQLWQVSYGPLGITPEQGAIVTCPIQVARIFGLDSCTDYVAYIRGVCDHDSIVYSEWSEGIIINICDTTSPQVIQNPNDNFTYIIPNPASNQVQVVSSFNISFVEVYNQQGILMARYDADSRVVYFSVEDWPTGLYYSVIHTEGGNFSKKIVVK